MMEKVRRAEIAVKKELNINKDLIASQMTSLIEFLQVSQQAFAWDYTNMIGLDPKLYTHRIYIYIYKPRIQASKESSKKNKPYFERHSQD